jgi:glycosyltransferase involved in cell wall biosynthesis
MNLKISIITVTYNSSKTIIDCIKSVNQQTHNNIEHIIIDGDSSDKTVEKIKSIENRVSKVISAPDKGIYDAMNKGVKISSGDIVGFLNSDDKFFNNRSLEIISDVFINKKNIDCVYGNLVYVNKKNKILRNWESCEYKTGLFEKSWTPAHPTFYCKKTVFEKTGLYNLNYSIAADVEFMLRVLRVHKLKSFFINENLVVMQSGGISNSGLKSSYIIVKEMIMAFSENNLNLNILKYLFYKFLKIKQFIK